MSVGGGIHDDAVDVTYSTKPDALSIGVGGAMTTTTTTTTSTTQYGATGYGMDTGASVDLGATGGAVDLGTTVGATVDLGTAVGGTVDL